MKKLKNIFSLMALFLVISSYTINPVILNSKNSNLNDPKKEVRDCWAEATAEADWYLLIGGSYEISEAIWDAVYDICSAQQYGIENCNGC